MVNLSTIFVSALVPIMAAASNFASDCNPLNNTCPSDPALGGTISLDFKKKTDYFSNLYGEDRTNYTENGLIEWFQAHGDGPSLRSNFYILYGKLSIECKIPNGVGIIANFFLQSDDGDEIDFEWISTFPSNVTTNYFGKGVTGDYDRGTIVQVGGNLIEEYHTYTIDWQKDQTTWSVDGEVIRTLKADSVANDGAHDYPVSPMRVFIGMWAAGDSSAAGTIEWAGGKTSLNGAPFIYHVKSVNITDGSDGETYSYDDKTGNNISINGKSPGGKGNTISANSNSTSASDSSSNSSTATSSSSSSSGSSISHDNQVVGSSNSSSSSNTKSGSSSTISGVASSTESSSSNSSSQSSNAGSMSAVQQSGLFFAFISATLLLI